MWKYTCNSGTGKRKIGRTFISLLKIFSIFTLFCGNSFRLGFIVKYFYLFFYALYRFTCSFICFFPPSKIRVVPEAVGTPPSATNRLAGLRAFFFVCVCVGHCWLLWVILMKKKINFFFSNLFVVMNCMCLPFLLLSEMEWCNMQWNCSV